MKLPIIKKLRKKVYQDIAIFQDTIIDVLYSSNTSIVMHGGTVIWRCFSGNRFSNDIDAYITTKVNIKGIKKHLESTALDYGINVEKVKDTGNLLFIGFSLADIYVKVELNHAARIPQPVTMRFERADGTFTDILCLSVNDLILEKIRAYSNRKFIRDIYDIYIISSYLEKNSKIMKEMSAFLTNVPIPIDEGKLSALIYYGAVPSFNDMIAYIKRKTL